MRQYSPLSNFAIQIAPHLFITEFRTIAADDLWLSPCYQRPSMTLHFTWKRQWPAVKRVLPLIEEKLEPFGARPHWAKLFTVAPARLQSQYAKMSACREILAQYDPNGKFRNEFIDRNIHGI
jgi:xylitol oxidase